MDLKIIEIASHTENQRVIKNYTTSLMIFWAITLVICGIIAVIFYLSIIQKAPEIISNSDLEVYKDQLINIDSELTRGIITADEGERIKAEVGRRILDIGKRKRNPRPPC